MFTRRGVLGSLAGLATAILSKRFTGSANQATALDRGTGRDRSAFTLTYNGQATASIDLETPWPKVDPKTGRVSWFRLRPQFSKAKPVKNEVGETICLAHSFHLVEEKCGPPKNGVSPGQLKYIRDVRAYYASPEYAELLVFLQTRKDRANA